MSGDLSRIIDDRLTHSDSAERRMFGEKGALGAIE